MHAIENVVTFKELFMLAVALPYNWTDTHYGMLKFSQSVASQVITGSPC